jgi:hypothetical protein
MLFVGFLFAGINSHAQIMRGTFVISGDLYARYHTSEAQFGDEKHLDFEIIPAFGFFVADNFSVNVAIGGAYNTSTYPMSIGEEKYETLSYYFEPSAKLYKAVSDKFYFNVEFFFLYGLSTSKFTPMSGTETETNYANISVGFRPGLTYFATEKIAFTASIGTFGYSMQKDRDTDTKSGTILADFGLNSLYFGVSFFIPKKI